MAGNRPGALVLHGLTATTQSVRGVADALAGAGFEVAVPLLPGHGTTVEDLAAATWDDWLAAAESAFSGLAPPVVVFGLSMGGSLACRLAADHDPLAGLVLVNPFVDPPAPSFRDALREMIATGFPMAPGIGGDIALAGADPAATREEGYDRLPLAAMLSLSGGLDGVAAGLPRITCPVLVMTSRVDHVVPQVSSELVAQRVRGPVERVWLERSWHVATLDHDRSEIERRTIQFALRVTAPTIAADE